MRFAESILASSSPLEAFSHGTADFPLVASTLADVEVTQALFEEVARNQGTQRAASIPSFTINGLSQPLGPGLDPFLLLRVLRDERKTINDLVGLSEHISAQAARNLLIEGSRGGDAQAGLESMLGDLFDARDVKEGGGLIQWWNNFEDDPRYKPWPTSVREYLRPSYPGQMTLVAKNLYNLVLALDLSQPDQLQFVVEMIPQYIARKIPIRFGVVPVVTEESEDVEVYDPATAVGLVMWHLSETVGTSVTLKVLAEASSNPSVQHIESVLIQALYLSLAGRRRRNEASQAGCVGDSLR